MVSKSELAIKWPVYRPRGWGQPAKARPLPRPWFGLDTERDSKTGEYVCGFAVGETDFPLGRLVDLPAGTYWIYNLAYDIEGMLRDLKIPEGWAAKEDGAEFPIAGGKAVYYHGKRFDFKRGKHKISFIEASSFFGKVPLSKIGEKYGRKEGVDASQMSLARYKSDKEYRQTVDSYCRQDARIVYNAVCDLDMGVRALGVELGATPGATARRFLTRLGPFSEICWKTHLPFLKSYCGGRFEITKRGILPDVRQYDLVSAYPWALSLCPWLTANARSIWTKRFSLDALYGTYCVSFKFDDYLGIAPRWFKGIRVYSKAQSEEKKTWLARPEVDWLIRNGADLTIHRGMEIFDENASDLWRQIILELFDLKYKKKEAPEGLGAKIILNSQYGVLIQLVRAGGQWVPLGKAKNPVDFAGHLELEEPPKEFEAGKYYAPQYAGHLTALTRVRLLDAAREVGPDAYIGGHTDSVLSTVDLKSGLGNGLGDWKLEKRAEVAQICKTGMYAMDDKVKVRGITRHGTPALLWQETHNRKSRCGIKSADNWAEVSVIAPKVVANNYQVERKRVWNKEFDQGIIERREWIDSQALANV